MRICFQTGQKKKFFCCLILSQGREGDLSFIALQLYGKLVWKTWTFQRIRYNRTKVQQSSWRNKCPKSWMPETWRRLPKVAGRMWSYRCIFFFLLHPHSSKLRLLFAKVPSSFSLFFTFVACLWRSLQLFVSSVSTRIANLPAVLLRKNWRFRLQRTPLFRLHLHHIVKPTFMVGSWLYLVIGTSNLWLQSRVTFETITQQPSKLQATMSKMGTCARMSRSLQRRQVDRDRVQRDYCRRIHSVTKFWIN